MFRPILYLLPVLILVSSISCKKEDPLSGIDKKILFAPPTDDELNSVQSIWRERDLNPLNVTVEETHPINNKLSFKRISFRLNGFKQYAAVLVPLTTKPVPVMFYIGGFGLDELPVSSRHVKIDPTTETLPFIYIVPALRGQYFNVMVNDKEYTSPLSEGSRLDAFDGAADDVITCLTAAGMLFPEADTSKAMIRGGSRGGIVALLAAERDKRFKLAAPVAFSVDFIGQTSTHQTDPTYKAQFLDDLINGKATMAETRLKMIASSPLYFCNQLPKTQMHCGENDRITPAAQGKLLLDNMKNLGLGDQVELFIYKNRDHDNIATDNAEMETRINAFFHQLY